MTARAVLTINLAALQNNYRLLVSALRARGNPRAGLMAVLKADAYGHGAAACGAALYAAGARSFAVSSLGEAEELRPFMPDADILILGYVPPQDALEAAEGGFSLSVPSFRYAVALSQQTGGRPLSIQIKLNTGMNRTGFPLTGGALSSTLSEIASITALSGLRLTGIYSHFATADDMRDPLYAEQLFRFRAALSLLSRRGIRASPHIVASASLLRDGGGGFPLCRAGLSLFGYPASDGACLAGLAPVAVLDASLIQSFSLPAGERVGYGGLFSSDKPERVGIFSLGYADGLPRAASGAFVYAGERPLQIVGRISMDSAACLLSGLPDGVSPSSVRIFGKEPGELFSLAAHCGTISYEILAKLGKRIYRKYIYGKSTERPLSP